MTTATTSRLSISDREFRESVQQQLQAFRRRLAELDSEIRSSTPKAGSSGQFPASLTRWLTFQMEWN